MSSQSRPIAAEPVVLAIDIGTSSVRSLLCDRTGQAYPATETQIPYRLHSTVDGGAEFSATALFDLLIESIDGALASVSVPNEGSRFLAVGVTSFWHSLLGLDAAGEPVTPILYWADSRSDDTLESLTTLVDPYAIWQQTGCRLHSSYWPAKLHWLRLTRPDAFQRVTRWVSFTEYAMSRLSEVANPGISYSMASGTGLLEVRSLIWNESLLVSLNISSAQLSPLIDVDTTSQLGATFATRWPPLAGVPWVPALGDGACANVGSGAIDPDRIALTLGTSGAMRIVVPAPPGQDWPVPDGLWAYRLDRDHAVLGGALSNGGNFRRWLAELTGLSVEDAAFAAAGAADGHGLTILPFVAGERSPGWHAGATGVIAGLTLATSSADLARAGLEAVAYRFARIYDALLPVSAPDHQIIANGGSIVSSPGWANVIASTLGHDLVCLPPGDEATARGAALVALRSVGELASLADAPDPALAAGVCEAVPDEFPRYQAGRARQLALENRLFPDAT